LHAILDNNIEVLCCTPTYALRLAEVAQQQQISLSQSRVRTLIVAGEPGGSIPAVRTRLSELWAGARIFDHHGMTEVGPVTFECPKQPGLLHVHEPAYLPEIIDPKNGQSVRPGEPGELVLTTLGRLGSPLLRYRTGDLVKAADPPKNSACACGRFDLALAGGILGRTDDMIVVRGVNVYPTAVEEIIRSVPAIAEYQVKITTSGSLPEMSVLIEPVADCQNLPEVVRKLENIFHAALTLRVPVTPVPIGTLPRFDMKAKRWLRS
jgi:phenylacetate-CoA ligase